MWDCSDLCLGVWVGRNASLELEKWGVLNEKVSLKRKPLSVRDNLILRGRQDGKRSESSLQGDLQQKETKLTPTENGIYSRAKAHGIVPGAPVALLHPIPLHPGVLEPASTL